MEDLVIVTKKQGEILKDRINAYKNGYGKNYKAEIVETHIKDAWGPDVHEEMTKLNKDELIRALYIGYEIEEAKEERALTIFEDYGPTAQEAVKEVLNILEIEIEGINK